MKVLATVIKSVVPLLVLTIAGTGAILLIKTPPEVQTRTPERYEPVVRIQHVERQDVQLIIRSEGTVRPRTQSTLVPEVSGVVLSVSPSWADGGFFQKDEVLLRIDPTDYELEFAQSDAQVAQATVSVQRETEEAAVALREWKDLRGNDSEPPPLVARGPQLAQARAALSSARALRERARLNLERTTVRAPYAGRVRQKSVDVGQYVTKGSAIARIYSVERAEVRLPIANRELAYLDLPLVYRGEKETPGPAVVLRTNFAGREFRWSGTIVRTEGEIDPQSRRVHAVAQVEDPYGRSTNSDRPPLAVGLFVQAEILGHKLENVVVLPRYVLRPGNRVLVVDEESRLRLRSVEVKRLQGAEVILSSGLEEGERVCASPLDVVVDGMRVRVKDRGTRSLGSEE